MEDLHMFHATKVSHNLFEYVYASRYQISIPCNNHLPIISQIELKKLNTAKLKFKDKYPHLSDFFLRTAKDMLLQTQKDWTVRKVCDALSCKQATIRELELTYAFFVLGRSVSFGLLVIMHADSLPVRSTLH